MLVCSSGPEEYLASVHDPFLLTLWTDHKCIGSAGIIRMSHRAHEVCNMSRDRSPDVSIPVIPSRVPDGPLQTTSTAWNGLCLSRQHGDLSLSQHCLGSTILPIVPGSAVSYGGKDTQMNWSSWMCLTYITFWHEMDYEAYVAEIKSFFWYDMLNLHKLWYCLGCKW